VRGYKHIKTNTKKQRKRKRRKNFEEGSSYKEQKNKRERNKYGVGHGLENAKERKRNNESLKFLVTVKIHNVVSHYGTLQSGRGVSVF